MAQLALSVLAEAILQKAANEAARSLVESLRYRPWNEHVMQREYEMRSELARLQALDRKTAP